jgi:hypothetical protein
VGRGIRFESHIDLPPSEQHVNMFKLRVSKPLKHLDDTDPAVDDIIYDKIIKKKNDTIEAYMKLMKENSIENQPNCFNIEQKYGI